MPIRVSTKKIGPKSQGGLREGAALSGRERVLLAAVKLLERDGVRGLSMRAVAKEAGIKLPTVQYHFSALSALLREACEQTLRRSPCDEDAEIGSPLSTVAKRRPAMVAEQVGARLNLRLGLHIGKTIGELTALAHIARQGGDRSAARLWTAARLKEMGALVSSSQDRRFVTELCVGLELLSIGCAGIPSVSLINKEVLQRALAQASPTEVPVWFEEENHRLAPVIAGETAPRPNRAGRPSDMQIRLLEAAVELFAEGGLSAMTYRALAAKVGTSISVVSHHHPTSAHIFYGVYRLIHRRAAWDGRRLADEPDPALSLVMAEIAGVRAHLLSFQALAAAAVEPGFQSHSWRIRLMRGGHFWRHDPHNLRLQPEDFDRHIFSVWLAGAGLLAEACLSGAESAHLLRRRAADVRARLGLSATPEY
ncbi:TetR family transcriptional regulator [Caenibius sp. WL]|uniref:TetR family transcriptional regulator n=1 Tax=Caenibius sp. WL TaxID=2872646 RepID=UPI001C99D337|nr:TetR family transcriptional regulator [Caenibius sp. WL]QZP07620.1 TetR family transcriptional regulator [Caenibius sp. WL]